MKFSTCILIFGVIGSVSCNSNYSGKETSGIYKVDFDGLTSLNYEKRGFNTTFFAREVSYYSDFYLQLKPDRTFSFSKPFYQSKESINGKWKAHDDPLAFTVLLYGDEDKYYTHMAMCEKIGSYVHIAIPNEHYLKRLPLIKIQKFP